MGDNNFFKPEDGVIVGHVIHEHGNGMSLLRTRISLIKLKNKNEKISIEELDQMLEGIDESAKRCNKSIDYLYNKFKEKHEQNK